MSRCKYHGEDDCIVCLDDYPEDIGNILDNQIITSGIDTQIFNILLRIEDKIDKMMKENK